MTAAANDTTLLGQADPASTTTSATYSSSRLLLSNTALLNISAVPTSVAVLANGDATSAASSFELWFRSWSGAQAVVEILGAAYQDLGANKGQTDNAFKVGPPSRTRHAFTHTPLLHCLADHALLQMPAPPAACTPTGTRGCFFSPFSQVFVHIGRQYDSVLCSGFAPPFSAGTCSRHRPVAACDHPGINSHCHISYRLSTECSSISRHCQQCRWHHQPCAQHWPHSVPGHVCQPGCALAAGRVPAAVCWARVSSHGSDQCSRRGASVIQRTLMSGGRL